MLVVLDTNTIWRHKPFEELGKFTEVLGVKPRDPLVAWKTERWPINKNSRDFVSSGFSQISLTLPPGWASRSAFLSQYLLWRRIKNLADKNGKQVEGVIVSSPHYNKFIEYMPDIIPVFYYASDDYRSYHGWGGEKMAELEKIIVSKAKHSFFVSDALADRTSREYGIDSGRISVSMNATEERFLPSIKEQYAVSPPLPYADLKRPILGIVGGINDRLDFDLLRGCADIAGVGTMVFVGPVHEKIKKNKELSSLLNHPKCVFTGHQDHSLIPNWMQCLDIALIPYCETELNYHSSPMRLFDHMASGRPVVATSACDQVLKFSDVINIAYTNDEFIEIVKMLINKFPVQNNNEQIRIARENLWSNRAEDLYLKIN